MALESTYYLTVDQTALADAGGNSFTGNGPTGYVSTDLLVKEFATTVYFKGILANGYLSKAEQSNTQSTINGKISKSGTQVLKISEIVFEKLSDAGTGQYTVVETISSNLPTVKANGTWSYAVSASTLGKLTESAGGALGQYRVRVTLLDASNKSSKSISNSIIAYLTAPVLTLGAIEMTDSTGVAKSVIGTITGEVVQPFVKAGEKIRLTMTSNERIVNLSKSDSVNVQVGSKTVKANYISNAENATYST